MTHHHHDLGQGHPARAAAPSLLRLSTPERLAGALVIAVVLWAAVWWAAT
jgi:hypothetical protein